MHFYSAITGKCGLARKTLRATMPSVFAALLIFSFYPAKAHHSWPAVFKEEEVIISGTVQQFLLRNPHSWLFVEVISPEGKPERWDVEMGPAMAYAKMGVTAQTFQPGDEVVILGNPGKQNPRWMHHIGLYRKGDGRIFGKDPRVNLDIGNGGE